VTHLVVALAGTDHHPFDRLVEWVDAAAVRRADVRFFVQHGSTTRPPRVAEGEEFLSHDRLVALLAEAAAVVCHGGPGTILDAREAGHVPLCLPRDPGFGEHVDGHQQRFATHAGEAGVVRHISTLEEFHRVLDHTLEHVRAPSAAVLATRLRDTARARLAAELDEVVLVRPRRLARLHRAPL
jgi:UDP-N-acetylglucosamine transferase subunit ALG13